MISCRVDDQSTALVFSDMRRNEAHISVLDTCIIRLVITPKEQAQKVDETGRERWSFFRCVVCDRQGGGEVY